MWSFSEHLNACHVQSKKNLSSSSLSCSKNPPATWSQTGGRLIGILLNLTLSFFIMTRQHKQGSHGLKQTKNRDSGIMLPLEIMFLSVINQSFPLENKSNTSVPKVLQFSLLRPKDRHLTPIIMFQTARGKLKLAFDALLCQ